MPPSTNIICGGSRTRTYNLLIYSQTNLLIAVRFLLAGEVGIEPTTHGLTVRCANQLRYSPIKTGNNNCNGLEPFKIKFSRLNLLNLLNFAACFL